MNAFLTRDRLVSEIYKQVEQASEQARKFGRYNCTLTTNVTEELREDICKALQKGPWRVFGVGNYFRLVKKDESEIGSSF